MHNFLPEGELSIEEEQCLIKMDLWQFEICIYSFEKRREACTIFMGNGSLSNLMKPGYEAQLVILIKCSGGLKEIP